jgi:hypothetical protein
MNKDKFTLCLCLALPLLLAGQNDHSLSFHSGPARGNDFRSPSSITASVIEAVAFNERSYLILQFEDIPDQPVLAQLAAADIRLLHYLPNYAYFASLPPDAELNSIQLLRAVLIPREEWKLSALLARGEIPSHAQVSGGIRVVILPYDGISVEALASSLSLSGISDLELVSGKIELTIPTSQLMSLAAHPGVMFIETIDAVPFSEGFVGNSQIRSNWVSNGPTHGQDGTGVSVAIADDGTISHADFKGRLQMYTTANTGPHGDMTSGLMSGAGNINPLGIGTAPGSFLHLYHINGYPHITNAVANYQSLRTVITSSSYGDGCGGVYATSARDLDLQAAQHRVVLHVFSAGNSGQSICGSFGQLGTFNGVRYGNITGGRKSAKHALLIGNTDLRDSLRTNSSRGPLLDGTIKPDLAAPGQGNLSTGPDNTYLLGGGTSAAAPTVGGMIAQLVQAAREVNQGADLTFAHYKTAVMNTAEDLGRPGPDYDYGWGRPHAGKAIDLIKRNWFFSGSVAHQGTTTHQIQVPAGKARLKVMVYWFDPAATPNAAKTQVNDLDMTMVTPAGTTVLPWSLSTALHLDSITRLAQRGVDRVNVMEQITLDYPQAGAYQIRIRGHLVPTGPQDYIIAYYMEDSPIAMAYPNGGEALVPGEPEILRWDAMGVEGSFTLDVSYDSTATWQTIAANIPGNRRMFDWVVPSVVSGRAFFRIRRAQQSDISDKAFHIIGLPNFQIQNSGGQQARISWAPVSGANQYTVYALGEKYMEPIAVTSDTNLIMTLPAYAENWYSVQARHSSGITGRRALAKSYLHLSCQVSLQLMLRFDQFPGETRWEIKRDNGMIVAQGGPYTGLAPQSMITENICIPYGCYELIVYDAYNDGMCCNHGNGFYRLQRADGTFLASGSQFGNRDIRPFCLQNAGLPLWVSTQVQRNPTCHGAANGMATVTANDGTGNYTYLWSNGQTTATINNIPAGSYSVTITDGQSQAVASIVVTQPAIITATTAITPLTCAGGNNGAAFLSIQGGTAPYQVQWSSGSANGTALTGLAAGTYRYTITDTQGCRISDSLNVTAPAPISLSSTISPAQSGTGSDIQISVSGGVAPFRFSWQNGDTTQFLRNMPQGSYSVTVTDANNCTGSLTTTIVDNNQSGYCAAQGGATQFQLEWINRIKIAAFENQSGNNNGYGDFTNLIVTLSSGSTFPIELEPGYLTQPYVEYWKVWIDLNHDMVFDEATELVYSAFGVGLRQGSFTLPANYTAGQTRMRIVMRYGSFPLPCGIVPYGEVEDYTVMLVPPPALPDYCAAGGSSNINKWVERIRLGSLDNVSGPNGGYADFTHLPVSASAGGPLELILQTGSNNATGLEHWRMWIDLNRDGDFLDAGEQILSVGIGNFPIHATVYLPSNITPGPARVRIAMRWNAFPASCGFFPDGEVEDYTIIIGNELYDGDDMSESDIPLVIMHPTERSMDMPGETIAFNDLEVYPNPARGITNLRFREALPEGSTLQLLRANGSIAFEQRIAETGELHYTLNLSGFNTGIYIVLVHTPDGILSQRLLIRD